MKKAFPALLFLLLFLTPSMAQDRGPFGGGSPKTTDAPVVTGQASSGPSFFSDTVAQLRKVLRDVQSSLSSTMRKAKENPWSWELFLLLTISFAYGVVETLLPGHQKSVIGAYFLSENARYGQGFLAGALFALFHAIVTIAGLFLIKFVLQLSFGKSVEISGTWTQTVSAYAVMLIGVVLFLLKLRDLKDMKRRGDLDQARKTLGFDLHDRIEHSYEPIPWKKFLPFIFFAAVLPCPQTILVLVFALTLGTWVLGLAAVLAISLGMAITLMGLAILVIWMKKRGQGVAYKAPGRVGVFTIEIASLAALVVLALLLLPQGNTV